MDLKTRYMGLELRNPLVPSASPLSETVDGILRMEDAGAGAVVMFSLFEEQIRHERLAVQHFMELGTESYAESLSYFPAMDEYDVGPKRYLELLREASERAGIPVIASLNGITSQGWVEYAREMEQAGAAAIELNLYWIPADPTVSGAQVEERYLEILAAVKRAVSVPVALKLGPYFSSLAHLAHRLDEAGVDALVLFNRFYQPDFDVEDRHVVQSLELSSAAEVRLPLTWIGILHGRLRASLAATTGVQGVTEVVKYLMAGADVVMTTSALLRHGVDHLATLASGLEAWLERKGYDSLDQLRGSMSQRAVADPSAFVRANYIRLLESYGS